MVDIVINYRTADEPLAALLLDQALTRLIGDRVFRDYSGISPGQRYSSRIWAAIDECRILVVVIGKRWAGVQEDGRRLIDDPDDFVRREIVRALKRDIPLVPILVGDARLPTPDELPDDLRALPSYQYRSLRLRGAEHEAERVAGELVALLGDVPSPAEPPRSADRPAGQAVTTTINGDVDARYGVIGIANRGE